MKTKFISVLHICFFALLYGNAFAFNDKEYSFNQSYPVSTPLNLVISTSGGNISAVGREGNTVDVSFIVAERGKVLDITFDQLKEYAEVEINNSNSKLEITVKNTIKKNISISFSIKAPINSAVNLNTSGGNINLVQVAGSQYVITSGGNINIEKIVGSITAKTSGGNIAMSNSAADFVAKTSGGNISIQNIDGKLDVATSGGNIEAENIAKGIMAKTSGGNISINKEKGAIEVSTSGGEIALDEVAGSIKASTSGGDIKANITKLEGVLELKTSGSSISVTMPAGLGLDLDLEAENICSQPSGFVGMAKSGKVFGKLNGGGIPVTMKTSGGDITVKYK